MSERTEIEMLLPWYATGKLSQSERDKVDEYLVAHPDMARQLEMISDERFETIMANEAIGAPPVAGADRLMARLDMEFDPEKSSREMSWLQSVWNDFSNAFQMPALRYAGIAAALVIAIQFTSIGFLVQNNSTGNSYTTASGPKTSAAKGVLILVTFKQSATAKEISWLLEKTGGSIIKGPLAGGFYQVQFDQKVITPEKTDALVKALEAQTDIIDFVSVNE